MQKSQIFKNWKILYTNTVPVFWKSPKRAISLHPIWVYPAKWQHLCHQQFPHPQPPLLALYCTELHNLLSLAIVEGCLKTKLDTCLPCCFKLFSDPNSKISLSNDAFSLGAGPPKIVTVTLKLAKNRFLKHFLSLFKGVCLLYFFKDQKLRETEKKLFFLRAAIQNNFVHFGGLKFLNKIFKNCKYVPVMIFFKRQVFLYQWGIL